MAEGCKKELYNGLSFNIAKKEGSDVAGLFRTCLKGFFRGGICPQAHKLRNSFLEEKYRGRR